MVKNVYDMKNITNWIFSFFLLVIIMLAFSCESTKHVDTATSKTDSSGYKELQRQIAEKDLLLAHYENKIKELEALGITFSNCPPAANLDSLLNDFKNKLLKGGCKQSTVDSLLAVISNQKTIIKRYADGSIEVQSNSIKDLQFTKQRLEETIADLKHDKDVLTTENEKLKTELSKKETSKVKDVKRSWFTGIGFTITLAIVALVVGGLLGWKLKQKKDKLLSNN